MRLCAKLGTKVHIIIIRDEYLREYYCFLGKKAYLCGQNNNNRINNEEISDDCRGCTCHCIV